MSAWGGDAGSTREDIYTAAHKLHTISGARKLHSKKGAGVQRVNATAREEQEGIRQMLTGKNENCTCN